MKLLSILLIALFTLCLQSCRDNLSIPIPAGRNYQQDAAVLNDFVDINKTTHEYYINSNKRSSAFSYVTNADAEELNSVNLLNLDNFRQSVSQVNRLSERLVSSHEVDYVVMITESEIYISQTKNNSPISLKRKISDNRVRRSVIALCNVTDYKEQFNICRSNYIETSIDLYPQSYKNAGWAFLVTCTIGDSDNSEPVKVLFCGVGSNLNLCFEWSINHENAAEWNFEAINLIGDAHIANLKFLH